MAWFNHGLYFTQTLVCLTGALFAESFSCFCPCGFRLNLASCIRRPWPSFCQKTPRFPSLSPRRSRMGTRKMPRIPRTSCRPFFVWSCSAVCWMRSWASPPCQEITISLSSFPVPGIILATQFPSVYQGIRRTLTCKDPLPELFSSGYWNFNGIQILYLTPK